MHLHDDWLPAVGLVALGLACVAAFVLYQLRAKHGLMNMALFRYRQFAMGALVAFIYGAGLFGSTYLLPVYMQMALHYTPSEAGLILLPAGLVLALTIIVAGRLADRVAPHLLVSAGLCLLALSFALMTVSALASSYLALTAWTIIGRIGLGLILPALSLGAMHGIEFAMIAQGASTINFLRQLGGALGVSLAGIVLQWRLVTHQTEGGGALPAFGETFLLVALFCAVAVLAAARMRAAPVRKR